MSPTPPDADDLINVSALNQFAYCQRRYWYYRFYPPDDHSPSHTRGSHEHEQYHDQQQATQERYLSDSDLGLHGRVDLLEMNDSSVAGGRVDDSKQDTVQEYIPVERKRGDRYYWNDELQLAGYCLLTEAALDTSINYGHLYTRETDTRHRIEITAATARKPTASAVGGSA